MNTAVQIGRSYKEWWFLGLAALAACLAAAGVMLVAVRHEAALAVSMAAAIAGFSAIMSALVIARSRFQIEVRDAGFLVRDRLGEREFTDEQVICAAFSRRSNYINGVLNSTTRTFDVWAEGAAGPERVKLVNRLAVGACDPLAAFIERVQWRLYERANASLAAGQSFEGEGWTLNQDELVVNSKREAHSVRFDALAAAEIFDSQLCVWQIGQDEPVLRIPTDSANTLILLRLLQERISKRPDGALQPVGDQLGRILFERKPGKTTTALLWLVPLATVGSALVIALLALFKAAPEVLLIELPVCFTGVLLWLIVASCSVEFRAHEHGVRRKWLFRTQQLRYVDVDVFTYSAIRQYVKGVYSGTNFTLTFASRAPGKTQKKAQTLTYSKHLRNTDEGLDHLRDRVSQLIAQRMTQQLAVGRPVTWTDSLRFLPEGLEYTAKGLFGRKPPVMFPYSQIHGCDAEAGTFHLWIYGTKKPVAKESVTRPNFFPGYLLLARILAARPAMAIVPSSPLPLGERG
jgi:hypothetical protein